MSNGPITCPACQSKISSDGRTLHERSARLVDLEQAESLVEKLEAKLAAVEAQQRREPPRPAAAPPPKPSPKKKSKKGKEKHEVAGTEEERTAGKGKGSWWSR